MPTVTDMVYNSGLVADSVMDNVSTILGYFVSEPVLILGIGIFFTGAVIGLVMRLFHR